MFLVVGGHSRNIGKTSLAAGLIGRFKERQWTAVKITQYGHGVCSRAGTPCGCEADPEHPVALSEEYEPGASDSGRFLAAGAARSFWLRTPAGQLGSAGGVLRRILQQNANVIVESNSILELAQPSLFLMLLDFACRDFKDSSLRFLDRADAYAVVDNGLDVPLWQDVACGRWRDRPQFRINPPDYATAALCGFVESRFSTDSRAR